MYDSLRVLVVSNMVPSTEVPQYGVFVMRQTTALEQAGCTVEVVGIEQRTTGLPGTLRKYARLRSQGAHAADRMQADVVLGHYLVPTALIARRVARSVGAPYVLVAHGGDVGHLERSRPLRTAVRKAVFGAAAVVAVSSELAARLTAVYPGLVVEVINTGVDRALFRPGTADLSLFGAAPSRPLIVQIGNLIERKNPERLAAAAERLFVERGGGELWIAGTGPLKEQLEGLPYVRLLGAVRPDRVPALLRGADVATLVALSEGYGLGALEAVACGVPPAIGIFAAAIYGGYFGGGLGIIVLAVLGVVLVDTLTRINALKQCSSLVINGAAALAFVFSGHVLWVTAVVMLFCALGGGYLGGHLAARLPAVVLQRVVIVVGVVVAVVYSIRTFG